jgi:hypothetical protein
MSPVVPERTQMLPGGSRPWNFRSGGPVRSSAAPRPHIIQEYLGDSTVSDKATLARPTLAPERCRCSAGVRAGSSYQRRTIQYQGEPVGN